MSFVRRSVSRPAFGLVLFLSTTSAALAEGASCASVAADPQSINSFTDSPDFPAMIASLAASCPEVLTALDASVQEIIAARPATAPRQSSESRGPVVANEDRGAAARLAALREATDALKTAAKDVAQAERRVQQALGRVDDLARLIEAQVAQRGLTLSDLAQARRAAARELRSARADLDQKSRAYDEAIDAAITATDQAQRDLDEAKARLSKATGGADAEKLMAELQAKYDSLAKDIAGIEDKTSQIAEFSRKLDAEIADMKEKIDSRASAFDEAKMRVSDAKIAIEKAELAMKEGKGSEADLKDAKITYEKAEADIKALDAEIEGLKRTIVENDDLRQKLDAERDGLVGKLADLSDALPRIKADYTTLSDLLSGFTSAQTLIETAAKEAKTRTADAEADRTDAENRTVAAEEEARDLLTLTPKEQDLLAAAQKAGASLASALSTLDTRQQQAQAELDKQRGSDAPAVQKAADALRTELAGAEATERAASDTQSALDRQMDEVTDSLDDLQGAVDGQPAS